VYLREPAAALADWRAHGVDDVSLGHPPIVSDPQWFGREHKSAHIQVASGGVLPGEASLMAVMSSWVEAITGMSP
jgi:hypothetical protein